MPIIVLMLSLQSIGINCVQRDNYGCLYTVVKHNSKSDLFLIDTGYPTTMYDFNNGSLFTNKIIPKTDSWYDVDILRMKHVIKPINEDLTILRDVIISGSHRSVNGILGMDVISDSKIIIDLKSSTTIAEKMNSEKYFGLLKELYNDITEPILNSHGEIYQYIGDEVVVTWTVEKGLADNNSLQCFFRITQVLQNRKGYYNSEYDLLPTFKAGLHIGEATVGEIGVIKKDIVFSGDVLNTTSRIQGECNNYDVNILLSSDLVERIHPNAEFQQIALGNILLKGKKENISLYTVKILNNY